MCKFKIGDRVRIKPNAKTIRPQGDNPTWVSSMDDHQGEVFIISKLSTRAPWIFGPGKWQYHPDWIELAYPDTPAGRKQEQLDIIAEKEIVLAETQKVIDAARARIAEIDNRPPAPGETWKCVFGTAKIVFVEDDHIFYMYTSAYNHGSGIPEATGASSHRFLNEFGYKRAD